MNTQQLVVICPKSDTQPPTLWCWKCDCAVEMPEPDWFEGQDLPRGVEIEMAPLCVDCAREMANSNPEAFTKAGFG